MYNMIANNNKINQYQNGKMRAGAHETSVAVDLEE